jgi:DAK2 domain fusion protein YloV
MRPVEGTILTVARAAAEAAEAARSNGAVTLERVLEAVDAAARDAVTRTPDLLPVLADAGVVDAGGQGFTLLVDAFLHVVDGRPLPEPQVVATPAAVAAHQRGDDVHPLRYEVMYLLAAHDPTIPAFKDAWDAIGDSIVVVGGDGLWNCHVHTNDVGAAIEAGIEAGRPSKIRVTDLSEQVEEEQWVREQAARDDAQPDGVAVPTAVVAVAVGDGIRRLLRSVGVQVVVAGGQSMNPSTAQILTAVEQVAADGVIVLPNNKNIVAVANQVDALTDRSVAVVPTHAVVESLAALVCYDPDADLATNVKAMTEAAERVRSGEVTQAVRDSAGPNGPIRRGAWIALTEEHGICASADSALDAAVQLIEHLADDDSELVTVLVGADAGPGEMDRLRDHVGVARPNVELEVHEGDQPLYPYLIGVE